LIPAFAGMTINCFFDFLRDHQDYHRSCVPPGHHRAPVHLWFHPDGAVHERTFQKSTDPALHGRRDARPASPTTFSVNQTACPQKRQAAQNLACRAGLRRSAGIKNQTRAGMSWRGKSLVPGRFLWFSQGHVEFINATVIIGLVVGIRLHH